MKKTNRTPLTLSTTTVRTLEALAGIIGGAPSFTNCVASQACQISLNCR